MKSIKFETWSPEHQAQTVDHSELSEVYQQVSASSSPTFTWNDGGDQVLIVTVGEDYSTATMLDDGTFSNLMVSDDMELCEINISGQPTMFPKGAVLPRMFGLEVLSHAEDFERLRRDFTWVEE